MATVTVPLLSEHKIEFVRNRICESLLGGIRFFSTPVPWFVYPLQIVVHQLPILVGSLFTAVEEFKLLSPTSAALICGVVIFLIICIGQTLNFRLQKHTAPVTVLKENANPILEGDAVVFGSCCSLQTVQALFPRKTFYISIFFHSTCCALLTGYGIIYLSPSRLKKLYLDASIAYLIFFFGWITICTGTYSLTVHAPPETATFRSVDRWEIKPLMRPFYMAVCYGVDLIAGYCLGPLPATINGVLHLVFVFLPLLWFLNILPPLDALFIWVAEQFQIWVAGGSPSVSIVWLFAQIFLWSLAVIVLCHIPNDCLALLAAVFGYVLSLDLVSLWRSVMPKLISKYKSKNAEASKIHNTSALVRWNLFEGIFLVIMLLTVIGLGVGFYYGFSLASQNVDGVVSFFGYMILLLFLCSWLGSTLQVVYLFGGFIRNCFYPRTTRKVSEFLKGQKKLSKFGILRNLIIVTGGPLILNAYIIIINMKSVSEQQTYHSNSACHLIHVVAVLRAFRWTWQQTECALLETTIVHLLVCYTSVSQFISDELVILLLASFINDRLCNFYYKLQTVLVLLITSVTQKKHHRPYSWCLFGLNVAFFPIVLLFVTVSALVSAPLLPLFTLPIFWIGFPRPSQFWPTEEAGLDDVFQDAVYYEELIPELVKELSRLIAVGGLCVVRPGDVFLLRFEDRLIWLSCVERGYGYYRMTAKGLELQQTSCHAVEATAVDAILEWAFERNESSQSRRCCRLNKSPFHVYSPLNVAVMETYVESKNVLTGVIHSPETLQTISDCFPKCLIWILLHHASAKVHHTRKIDVEDSKSKIPYSDVNHFGCQEELVMKSNGTVKVEATLPKSRPSTTEHYERLPKAPSVHDMTLNSVDPLDDPWFDEDDPLDLELESNIKKPPVLLRSFMDLTGTPKKTSRTSWLGSLQVPGSIEDATWDSAGSKETDVKTKDTNAILDKPLRFDEVPESSLTTGFPKAWLRSPVSQQLLNAMESEFPNRWFRFIFDGVFGPNDGKEEQLSSETILPAYRLIVLTCHSVINQVQAAGKKMSLTPSLVYRTFIREFPWSLHSSWLLQNPSLLDLAIIAYRYACKLALDQALLGSIETDAEFDDYLKDYQENWFIGPDSDPAWLEAVHKRVPNLFSLGYNPSAGTYTSHLLTRRRVPISIGKLNRETVNAIWSSLNFELLYLTNDDEERYSIQAHSGLLRNLTVQGADPPLGYPIYVSQPLLIKALLTNTQT